MEGIACGERAPEGGSDPCSRPVDAERESEGERSPNCGLPSVEVPNAEGSMDEVQNNAAVREVYLGEEA